MIGKLDMAVSVEIEEPTWNTIASSSKYDNKLISNLKLDLHALHIIDVVI